MRHWRDWPKWIGIRRVLREAVARADLVHTSNYFPPYLGLAYAHDIAVKMGKKTVFVITEDFFDMLAWEWCRLADGRVQRWRRERSWGSWTIAPASARPALLLRSCTPRPPCAVTDWQRVTRSRFVIALTKWAMSSARES